MSLGGSQIRLRISNAFGINDLPISAVTIALPKNNLSGQSGIQPDTLKTVTFSGNKEFIIPSGALAVSDPIRFDVLPQSTLSVSLYLAEGQAGFSITSHPGSRATTWMVFGNHVDEEDLTDSSITSVAHWWVDKVDCLLLANEII
jgi:hypothetical protein